MNQKKRPDTEIVAGQQIVSASVSENDLRSFYEFIINSDGSERIKKQMCYLISWIPQGHRSPVLTADLIEKTGLAKSVIKRRVYQMRLIGIPIASSIQGYYLCSSEEEKSHYYGVLMKRVRHAVRESESFIVSEETGRRRENGQK